MQSDITSTKKAVYRILAWEGCVCTHRMACWSQSVFPDSKRCWYVIYYLCSHCSRDSLLGKLNTDLLLCREALKQQSMEMAFL